MNPIGWCTNTINPLNPDTPFYPGVSGGMTMTQGEKPCQTMTIMYDDRTIDTSKPLIDPGTGFAIAMILMALSMMLSFLSSQLR